MPRVLSSRQVSWFPPPTEYVSLTVTVLALFAQDLIQIMNLIHAGRESTPFPTAVSPAQPQGPLSKGRSPASVEGKADMWNISEL